MTPLSLDSGGFGKFGKFGKITVINFENTCGVKEVSGSGIREYSSNT